MTTATTHEIGVFENVPFDEYLRWPGAHVSLLNVLRGGKSPAHVRAAIETPSEPTDAMVVGTALHHAILEPEKFDALYLRGPDGPLNRNPWKAEWDAMKANLRPGQVALKAPDYDACRALQRRAQEKKSVRALLAGSRREVSARWRDPMTGGLCVARFDVLNDRLACIVDVKKSADASPDGFLRSVMKYGYHVQQAHYSSGAREVGLPADRWAWLVFEAEPPHEIACYQPDADLIDEGFREWRELIERFHACERSGEWPGYEDKVLSIGLPRWARRNEEES